MEQVDVSKQALSRVDVLLLAGLGAGGALTLCWSALLVYFGFKITSFLF
jgi:hypothetical protein